MNGENLKEVAERGERIKDMMQNVPGWKDIEVVMKDIRDEAFAEWSELPMNAPAEKVLMIRSKEQVLKEFMARIREMVALGIEARERIAIGESESMRFDFKPDTPSTGEIERLFKKLTRPFFGRDNPNGAAKEKTEAR